MRLKSTSRSQSSKHPKPERKHGVEKATHRDKKDQERSVGHGMRTHEKRFKQERIAAIYANPQGKYVEKVKAEEKLAASKQPEEFEKS